MPGSASDVAVIGAGIVGCALAAFLAEAGVAVVVYDAEGVAAGASGRNSGVLQHPLDKTLAALYEESLLLYADLGHGFELPPEAAGVLVLSEHDEPLRREMETIAAEFPELEPAWQGPESVRELEPGVAAGLSAYRLETGRPVPPAAAAGGFAERAAAAGARFVVGERVTSVATAGGGRVAGVRVGERLEPAGTVVVAAGAATPELVDPSGAWRPIAALWGVVAEVELDAPPRHVLEETGVETLTAAGGGPPGLFSLVTTKRSSVGSSFDPERPDAEALARRLIEHAARFVPALAGAGPQSVRSCARPLSRDGRPLLGPLPGVDGLFVASGHGPWGISLGPASAQLVCQSVLRGSPVAPELSPARFGPVG